MTLTHAQRGIITLIGGFLLELVSGTVLMWGSLNIYITSYFRSLDDPELKVSTSGAIFPLMMMSLAAGIPIGMRLVRYFNSASIACIISSIIAAAAMFVSSYMQKFWHFVVIFAIVQGVAQGMIYFVPIYIGYLYFPKNRGLVSGITTGGFAICQFVFGLIFYKIVNPNGLAQVKNLADGFTYFEGDSLEVALNVPSTLRIISGITLVVSIFSSLLILYHPDQDGSVVNTASALQSQMITTLAQLDINNEEQQQPLPQTELPIFPIIAIHTKNQQNTLYPSQVLSQNSPQNEHSPYYQPAIQPAALAISPHQIICQENSSHDEEQQPVESVKTSSPPSGWEIELLDKLGAPTAILALKQPQFYMSIFLGILCSGIGVLVNGNFKSIAKDAGFTDDSYQTLLGSLSGLANGFSRPLWATLLDKFSFKQIITVILVIEVIFSFTMRFAQKSQTLLGVWVFVTQMTFGAVLSMWSVLSAQINGVRIGSEIFGMYWCGFAIGNFLQFVIVLVLRDSIGFDNIYLIYTALSLFSFVIVFKYNFKVKWSKYYLATYKSTSKLSIEQLKK